MAKWKLITTNPDQVGDPKVFEEEIEADNIQVDQSGNYLIFSLKSNITVRQNGQDMPVFSIVRVINTRYVVEAVDLSLSRKSHLLAN